MTPTSRCLPYYRPNPAARLRLFCLPYAGGGASVFRDWSPGLPAAVDACAVQLPGRENRLSEPPATRLDTLVATLGRELVPYLDLPFAFFGHSMGGRIGFELARWVRRERGVEPALLFVSATRAPQVPNDDDRTHALPDAEFMDTLRRMKGVPGPVLDNPELREIFLPILRADFTLFETSTYVAGRPLSCPIGAFAGLQDTKLHRDNMDGWREQTASAFTMQMLPGDHFYVQTERALLLRHVSRILAPVVGALP